jgi:hypothetical protein
MELEESVGWSERTLRPASLALAKGVSGRVSGSESCLPTEVGPALLKTYSNQKCSHLTLSGITDTVSHRTTHSHECHRTVHRQVERLFPVPRIPRRQRHTHTQARHSSRH